MHPTTGQYSVFKYTLNAYQDKPYVGPHGPNITCAFIKQVLITLKVGNHMLHDLWPQLNQNESNNNKIYRYLEKSKYLVINQYPSK